MNDIDLNDFDSWLLLGNMANSAAMDWYALAHHEQLPSQSTLERLTGFDLGTVSPRVGLSVQGATGTQLLVWGLMAVGAIWVIAKLAK